MATSLLFACGVSDWVSLLDAFFRDELIVARRVPGKALQREIHVRVHPRPCS